MNLTEPKNKNYCMTVAKISNINALPGCDNVVGAIVSNYQVIVSKESKVGDIGIFCPVECQLSTIYLSNNNLYRHSELNSNKEKKGYFEDSGRLKCVKFRGHKSEGLFMPMDSLAFTGINIDELNPGDEFDELNTIPLCQKYYVEVRNTGATGQKKSKIARTSRMVDGQFHLHIDTEQLKKNMHKIGPDTVISVTSKWHGTSAVISKVLVKRSLSFIEKVAKYFGVKVVETEYDTIYASRNVVKNEFFQVGGGYYKDEEGNAVNLWKHWGEKLSDRLEAGFTLYGEIVGYTGGEKFIQKGYHYCQEKGTNEFYCYRITVTNVNGRVIELNRLQINEMCERLGIKVTPMFFFGKAKDLYPEIQVDECWSANFLENLDNDERLGMNNVMCKYNNKEVPSEGVVVRIESLIRPEPFKLKNYKFLERETKEMDKGEVDIETEQSV